MLELAGFWCPESGSVNENMKVQHSTYIWDWEGNKTGFV